MVSAVSLHEEDRCEPESNTPNSQNQTDSCWQRSQTRASKQITTPNHARSIEQGVSQHRNVDIFFCRISLFFSGAKLSTTGLKEPRPGKSGF